MEIEEKEQLARLNDMSTDAMALRLRAARLAAGFPVQKELAKAAGVTGTALNNAEKAINAPSLKVMRYLFRNHEIDFNFILHGNFTQLPGPVQARLFAALSTVTSEQDQTAH